MTPEQCHPVHCNPQQVEGSAGWDRHSSGDLHNQQMDGQDEGSRRIYNQRDLTKTRMAIWRTRESSSCVVSKEEEKKKSSSNEARGWTLTPSNTPLTILLPNDPTRPLTKSSQSPVLEPASLPNSLYWAYWIWVRSHLQWKKPPKSRPYRNKIKYYINKERNRIQYAISFFKV